MKRNLLEMSRRVYDVCVVGGGVYGACIAWDASLRGLSVALIEKGDFGHATSSKTLRVIHGGFRYLQHLDLLRVRRAIRERAVWMRIAPHLVHPLPVVVPTYRSLTRGRNAFRLALKVNDLIGWDRNRLGNRDRIIPAGRLISKSELLRLAPRIDCRGVTGGALWFDCQMRNSERLILSILQSAVQAGADVANYVEATASLDDGEGLRRVEARDVLGDGRFAIRARLVVEACGPWLGKLWEGENGARRPLRGRWLKAMNLVTKPLVDQCALGLWLGPRADGAGESRFVFIAPWHGHSLVGTTQAPYDGDPDCLAVGEQEIDEFMGQVNSLFDGGGLAREDIRFVHAGIVP
ncbi:MAG TPA: FAD-dependent oxidoreductase, partial [Candidatus Eisenbacteria bacterium]|nr:FAD-dependent oxidoreductase [Candidatus Eisenbacteria bacterium]